MKNSIVPKQSDKTLQERLNEVCEKHGVSTLQDLDLAFCKTEARLEDYTKILIDKHKALEKMLQYKVLYKEKCRDINTQERFFALKIAYHKYKRCLDKANYWLAVSYNCIDDKHRQKAEKHHYKWLEIAKKFKEGV